ncbi:SDR family NAD(P)-dependent oxidoreductase [Rhodococcus artemisiae]|uniref:SDR family NAD(P)-dependent oxidoreductase n=1 Tax=Rhodococcus artemisiae TaxID=714159 RepID=A0ABU7LIY2_9NOCA|nr:SDR family NAD(P)-dependent oxidoreductase [Rhodococcus artemisiae]MEE2061199.1 SDR family NAD(P)-dependent oxidoreductase [Rhodococcus artemisiae]
MTTHNASTVLVTGATGGLGAETCRRLAAAGHTVWMGVRTLEAGYDVAGKIRVDSPDADVRVVELDVTSDDSVTAAYRAVSESGTGLDVLVNNAGIAGRVAAPTDTVPTDFLPVFGVNLLGPVRVTHIFLPLLAQSPSPRLVMVSSGMGSFAVTNDPARIESTLHGLVYPSSKAALNMVATMYAKALPSIRVVAVDPGYTATALNGFSGTQSVEDGTDAIVEACTADSPAGMFIDRHGPVPW